MEKESNEPKYAAKNATKCNKEARRRYNREHYKQIVFEDKKEVVEAFREKCRREGISQSAILRKAIMGFLDDDIKSPTIH